LPPSLDLLPGVGQVNKPVLVEALITEAGIEGARLGGDAPDLLTLQEVLAGDQTTGDRGIDPFQQCLSSQYHLIIVKLIAQLPGPERQVLTLYYYYEVAMHDIARIMGVGPSRISQVHSLAIRRLRDFMQAQVRGFALPQP